jgi:hypothetical protein
MPSLRILHGDASGQSYRLDREVTVLGRDAACEIVLTSQDISKKHARITRKDGGYYIEDLRSTNGTRVGDRELTETRRLEDGDLIQIGDFRLVFSGGGPTVLSALDASSTEQRHLARVRSEDKLCAVLEIAREIAGTIDLEGVLGKVLEALFRVFPVAERGFVLLRGEAADDLNLRASKVREPEAGPPLFSKTMVFQQVMNRRMRSTSWSRKLASDVTAEAIDRTKFLSPLSVCFFRTSKSLRNAKLSQTNTRLPAQKPSGNDLSTELRIPTASVTPEATGVPRSMVPKNRPPSRITPNCSFLIS